MIDYIYTSLGMDLDCILPFAALPENGREVGGLDDKSELAHRMMLVNILRLTGAIKNKKTRRNFITRPTQVILPLSPNHGLFGEGGLYSEPKISLETLFNCWSAESWGEYLCLACAVIGCVVIRQVSLFLHCFSDLLPRWTRGTGLTNATSLVSQGPESYGVGPFTAKEMALNNLGLMYPFPQHHSSLARLADLNGGMDRLPNLTDITSHTRDPVQVQPSLVCWTVSDADCPRIQVRQ